MILTFTFISSQVFLIIDLIFSRSFFCEITIIEGPAPLNTQPHVLNFQ